MTERVYIIAEAGVNHNGDRNRAIDLVIAAKAAGADAVKFQTARADNVVVPDAPKAVYQNTTTDAGESQIEMLRRILLPYEDHHAVVSKCEELSIDFLSTPFDLESLKFLVDDLGVSRLKIPSGEITNGPLLLAAGLSGLDIILSTGMCTVDDIENALSILTLGYNGHNGAPGGDLPPPDLKALQNRVTLLQCTTEYPAPIADANLNAMESLGKRFGLAVGLSDHTEGIVAAIAATALGAVVVEKHFTLDRNLPGPDHKASLEPDVLSEMIAAIRQTTEAMGDGLKTPSPSEIPNMAIARKSLVALTKIKKGEVFTAGNLGAKRPGTGISPMKYWEFLGRPAAHNFQPGDLIEQ
jgi:N-acetylneuraminate synthase